MSTRAQTDTTWLRLVHGSVAVGVVSLVGFAYVAMFFDTISEGDFKYTVDYWYTGWASRSPSPASDSFSAFIGCSTVRTGDWEASACGSTRSPWSSCSCS